MSEEIGFARLSGVVKRRHRSIFLATCALAVPGLWGVSRMPPGFLARAVVRIDDPRPARDYVAPTVTEPGLERLRSARLGFLARPLIVQAAESAGLLGDLDPAGKERQTTAIAARLDARQEGEDTFVVTYVDREPSRARSFLAALIDTYVRTSAAQTMRRTGQAADFFAKEVQALKPRVADAEAIVERFRVANHGALPDQLAGNLHALDEIKMEEHSLLSSLDHALDRRRAIRSETSVALRRQEEAALRALSESRARYAASAPEVESLQAELARVRSERERAEDAPRERSRRSTELRDAEAGIIRLEARLRELEEQKAALRRRVEATTPNGETLARLAVERDLLRERFRSVVAKHEEAVLAAGMEADVAGQARVRVLEPAWAHHVPTSPHRRIYAIAALLSAVFLAFGVGFLKDALDPRVRSDDDLRALLGNLPLIGMVPELPARTFPPAPPAIPTPLPGSKG